MTTNLGKAKALFVAAFAVALCFALAGCGGSSSSSAASSAASSSAASESASSSSESASASSASASASAASSSAAASASSAAASSSDLLDEHMNITLYALFELTGPELVDLLDSEGYVWDDAKGGWFRQVDGALIYAVTDNGQYAKTDYSAKTEKGSVASVITCNVVGGFKDAEAALSGNAHCVIEDMYVDPSDGSAIAIVYGPSMKEYLVIAQQNSESTAELDVYSQEAVGSGMLDKVYGGQIGGSFKDVWKTFTGQDSYGR
ncbi:MAG: hypothetical protein IJ111_02985 [Eggerthellaceae bacterium]|nr:hypothetical protein [Eggerthellaceae bacterium]